MQWSRRLFIAFLLALGACAGIPVTGSAPPPIIFVHGNGDTAALWNTTIWRFESNGYDRGLLHAIDFRYPLARAEDPKPQPLRSSSAEALRELADKVDEVRTLTGSDKVVLIGNSRGGNAIRNYIKNGGGAAKVSHAILGGTPNHGVSDWEETRANEFNGKGPFLIQLNAGPNEVVEGVRFMTIRSDNNDKYAQPDGAFLGKPGRDTGVPFDGPELKGAENVVIPKIDHRETAFDPLAFAEMYRFIMGRAPERLTIASESRPVLNGKVNGVEAGVPTNLPVAGAKVEVYEVAATTGARIGRAVHTKTTGADGLWGPFSAQLETHYEYVVEVPGHSITHIYRSPYPRSSAVEHFRPATLAKADQGAGSVITITRPRGYFGHGRDIFTLDGKVPAGINPGVPGASTGKVLLPPGPMRAVPARFNDETITVQNWPAAEGHVVFAEFHY